MGSRGTVSNNERYTRAQLTMAVGVVAVAAVILSGMGQVLWCKCGSPVPWSFNTWSEHNSQHILDPYSFSHMQHGLVFFGLLALAGDRLAVGTKLVIAMGIEAAWEVIENTPMVIDRYREATISLEYYGDSVANSASDLAACWIGFEVARRVPWWGTVGLFVVIELTMVWAIKDSLLLNVLMLVYPLDAVLQWQGG